MHYLMLAELTLGLPEAFPARCFRLPAVLAWLARSRRDQRARRVSGRPQRSLAFRFGEARRRLVPGIALDGAVVAELEQRDHIGVLEGLLEHLGEALRDVGEIEVEAVAPGRQVDPVEVAHALGLDQRGDGAGRDA